MESLMTVREAAEYVRLSEFTLRRLAKLGKIPSARLGRTYRFNRDDIDKFIRSQYKETNGTS